MSLRTISNRTLVKLGEASLKFQQIKTVRSVTEGLINLIPLVLIGSVCLAISNVPLPPLHAFLDSITMGNWSLIADIIVFSTEDIVGLAALLSVSYTLAAQNRFIQKRTIPPFVLMLTAFVCYIALFVWDPAKYAATLPGQPVEVLFTNPGRSGVFGAIFVALVSVRLFILFAKLWQKLPWGHWRVLGSHQQVRLAIATIFPIVCTLVCFVVLRLCIDVLLSSTSIEESFIETATHIVSEGSLQAVVLSVFFMQALWFFGAHGSNTIQSFMEQNNALSGAVPTSIDPSTMFSSPDFYSIFVDIGGTGTAFALLLAMLIFASANKGRRLARLSIFPVVFNINETLIFGVPVVLNPFFIVPFILAPVISAVVAYGAFSLGVVPPMTQYVEWTTPFLFSGYLSTGSLAGALLQLISVGLAFLVYAPFVIATRIAVESNQIKQFDSFKKEASRAANNEQISLASRRDSIGEMARNIITEITLLYDGKSFPFHLVYQPKTNAEGRIVGAEALLRWEHPSFGPVPPDALIELTDEADLSIPLGRWITTQALEERARWQKRGISQLTLSINLNPHHIFVDEAFPDFLAAELKRLNIEPSHIDLEITEHIAVHASSKMLTMFRRLREVGVKLSIDDMGMGYSSLTYISDFGVSVVKIDISLIDKVTSNVQQQEIVRSIIELAQQLGLAVIVEGVERREQVDALVQLGCRYFQGYYFSRPLEPKDFIAYIQKHGVSELEHEVALVL